MKKTYIGLLILFSLIIGCSTPTENLNTDIENSVQISENQGQIKISNNSDIVIHYFAVEQIFAELINWAPFNTEHNKVFSKSFINFNKTEISKNENSELKSGDKIIVFYWNESENPKIYYKIVTL